MTQPLVHASGRGVYQKLVGTLWTGAGRGRRKEMVLDFQKKPLFTAGLYGWGGVEILTS